MEKKQRVGWVLYDFANSTLSLAHANHINAFIFSTISANIGGSADLQWSIVVSSSVFAAGFFCSISRGFC